MFRTIITLISILTIPVSYANNTAPTGQTSQATFQASATILPYCHIKQVGEEAKHVCFGNNQVPVSITKTEGRKVTITY